METEYYKANFIASSNKVIKVREMQTQKHDDFVKYLKAIEDEFNRSLSKKGLSEYHINATAVCITYENKYFLELYRKKDAADERMRIPNMTRRYLAVNITKLSKFENYEVGPEILKDIKAIMDEMLAEDRILFEFYAEILFKDSYQKMRKLCNRTSILRNIKKNGR